MKRTLTMFLLIAVVLTLTAIQRNKVVVEIGTGTWCQYCPGAAMGADDLVENGHQVAIIENHNGDTYANAASNARNTYYGISSYPTARFDGLNPIAGGYHSQSMYANYLPSVNSRLAVESHFTISASGTVADNNYNINVLLNKVENDTNTNILLHAVVTQSHIQQVWQGQTHLEFVQRMMIPSQTGTSVNFSANPELSIPLTFTMNPLWVVNNCELVLFLQNNTTKEILQGVKYSFPELFGAYPASAESFNFPDTYLTNTATQTLTLNNYWGTPVTGSIVSDNTDFIINPVSRLNFTIQPYHSLTYNIVFAPSAVGNAAGNLTITSNFPDHGVITIPLSGFGYYNTAPIASDVAVSGVPVISMMQAVDYTFSDADEDDEGTTLYQWYRISAIPEPTPISNANAAEYLLQQSDVGYAIACKVTPYDEHGMPGTPVMSTPTAIIETYPTPQNLTAVVENEVNVALDWDPPNHFSRGFRGYKVFRNNLNVYSTSNIAIIHLQIWKYPTEIINIG